MKAPLLTQLQRFAQAYVDGIGPRGAAPGVNLDRLIDTGFRKSLGPALPKKALPGAIAVALGTEEYPVILQSTVGILMHPASDGAPYGWGDPYEVDGVPINPPLGTVQTVLNIDNHIKRVINDERVIHGVNHFAGERYWQSGELFLTWSESGVYSHGEVLVGGSGVGAACVQTIGGTTYLVWYDDRYGRVYADVCTITDGVVVSVAGSPGYFVAQWVSGIALTSHRWAEFSQDGTKLAISFGSPGSEKCSEFTLPSSYTSQIIIGNLVAYTGLPVASFSKVYGTVDTGLDVSGPYIDTLEMHLSGTQSFFLKSEYIDNVLTEVWLDLEVSLDVSDYPQDITCEDYLKTYCLSCDGSTWDSIIWHWYYYTRIYTWTEKIYATLRSGANSRLFKLRDYAQAKSDYEPGLYEFLGGSTTCAYDPLPWPGDVEAQPFPESEEVYCHPVTTCFSDSTDFIDRSQAINTMLIDLKKESILVRDLGYLSQTASGCLVSSDVDVRYFEPLIMDWTATVNTTKIDNDYGRIDWPALGTLTSTADVEQALVDTATLFEEQRTENRPLWCSFVETDSGKRLLTAWAKRTDLTEDWIDWYSHGDIDALLSIDGETNPRLMLDYNSRYRLGRMTP
jgi:hypothetical protein